jgi:hypothetical protein
MIATTACIALVASLVAAQDTTITSNLNSSTSVNFNTTTNVNYNTTTSVNFNTTATTIPDANTTVAAVMCTDEACCTAIEEGEQPCTKCAKSQGCTFYGLFNNDAYSPGGKCVLSTTTTPPTTGYKKIEQYGQCADGIAAVMCTDDACCKKFEEGKQPCTKCTKSQGCTYYGLFNNNVFSAGGKCVHSGTTSAPTTGYKKVEKYGQCADLCDELECSACLEIPECKWCDTAASVGVGSTGSCELEKCLTGVTALTTCSASTNAVAAFAAVVALLASL